MIRALWFFALFAALVVVAARCLSAFPVGVALGEPAVAAALTPASHAPADSDSASGVLVAEDSDDGDDGMDALLAPPVGSFELRGSPVSALAQVGVLSQPPPLKSHTQGLERPPRVAL